MFLLNHRLITTFVFNKLSEVVIIDIRWFDRRYKMFLCLHWFHLIIIVSKYQRALVIVVYVNIVNIIINIKCIVEIIKVLI